MTPNFAIVDAMGSLWELVSHSGEFPKCAPHLLITPNNRKQHIVIIWYYPPYESDWLTGWDYWDGEGDDQFAWFHKRWIEKEGNQHHAWAHYRRLL